MGISDTDVAKDRSILARLIGGEVPTVLADALRQCRPHFMAAAIFSLLINILYLAPTLYMLQVYDRVVPTAGKTTLLNRILTEDHGRRYAVIVNEFGEIGIDNDLVVGADEEVFEMNNGCVCCTVRGDLIRIMDGLMKRKGKFDAIIVDSAPLGAGIDAFVCSVSTGCSTWFSSQPVATPRLSSLLSGELPPQPPAMAPTTTARITRTIAPAAGSPRSTGRCSPPKATGSRSSAIRGSGPRRPRL